MEPRPLITFLAPAKVNLALDVGGPLPAGSAKAGYHPIASWMACTGLVDELRIYSAESGLAPLTIEWAHDAPKKSPLDWPLERDLTARALEALNVNLEARGQGRMELCVELLKRIPVGAGLGGGSADAAAMLMAANAVCGLGMDVSDLAELTLPLGSDIAYFMDGGVESSIIFDEDFPNYHPVCIVGAASVPMRRMTYVLAPRPAIVTQLGEQIERTLPVRGAVCLVVPPFGCATAPVYRAFDRNITMQTPDVEYVRGLVRASERDGACYPLVVADTLRNGLEAAASSVEPRLADILTRLRRTVKFPVHLTGSGSCMFILTPDDISIGERRRIEDACSECLCSYVWTAFDP
jgi:4-diphosphocytidyl-2C-methyl-D-erythritol kinase